MWPLANYPFFFDGPEYVKLAEIPIVEAIRVSHASLHPVSIIFWHLMRWLVPGTAVWPLSLVSALAGIGCIYLLVQIAREYRANGWISGLAIVIFPLTWLLYTNVATEPVTHLFALLTWYLWLKKKWIAAWAAGVLAVTNYAGMLIWLAGWLLVAPKKTWKLLLAILAGWAAVMAPWLVREAGQGALLVGLTTALGWAHAAYQASVAFGYNYGYISLAVPAYFLWKRNWKVLGLAAIYIISMSWWHGGIFGRIGGFAAYPLALGLGKMPKKLAIAVLAVVLLQWGRTVLMYTWQPIPEVTRSLIEANCAKERGVVIAETERPQLEEQLVEAGWKVSVVTPAGVGEISRGSCLTSQAVSYPYRQWDGQMLHPLPGRAGSVGIVANDLGNRLVKLASEEKTGLAIYELRD